MISARDDVINNARVRVKYDAVGFTGRRAPNLATSPANTEVEVPSRAVATRRNLDAPREIDRPGKLGVQE